MKNYILFYVKRFFAYLIIAFLISSFFDLLLISEYLEPLEQANKNRKFHFTHVTKETHELAVNKNYIGLVVQHFTEQMPGYIGAAISVAAVTTCQYRKKQKDLEVIKHKYK